MDLWSLEIITFNNCVSKGTKIELTALTPKTTYFINIAALNRSGYTVISSGIYLTTN